MGCAAYYGIATDGGPNSNQYGEVDAPKNRQPTHLLLAVSAQSQPRIPSLWDLLILSAGQVEAVHCRVMASEEAHWSQPLFPGRQPNRAS
jgi:hypothetical protein